MDINISTYNKIPDYKNIKIEKFDVHKRYTKPHKHDKYLEIVYFIKGKGFHHLDLKSYKIKPSTVFVIKKDEVHHWEITTKPKGYVIIIKEAFLENTLDKFINYQLLKLHHKSKIKLPKTDVSIKALFKSLTWEKKQEIINSEAVEGGLKALLSKLVNYAHIKKVESTDILLLFTDILSRTLKNNVNFYADKLHTTPQNLNAICRKEYNKSASDIDLIIVACAYTQRSYPAMAIEIQQALGCSGWGFDMLVACSAATFGIINAANAIRSGTAKTVLVINPEILSPQINYKDRDSHFIFGDVATASIIEDESTANSEHQFKIIAEQPITQFSNNIRSNIGYMNQCSPDTASDVDKYFIQQGRKVFKEVLPMVSNLIASQMEKVNLAPSDIKRLYLHQANINMNNFIGKKVLGRDPTPTEAPIILDEYANTSSAGCIIALHKHNDGFSSGDKSVLCSFGAGYSACCLILEYV